MTIKLNRYDRFLCNISRRMYGIGARLDNKHILRASGKLLDYVALRNGWTKQTNVWVHNDNTIEF